MYKIVLLEVTEDLSEPLLREISGKGGFQSLLRRLTNAYDPGKSTFTLTAQDVQDIFRYATQYKQGGFQDRLYPLLESVYQINEDLSNILEMVE